MTLRPCPECGSDNLYHHDSPIRARGSGGHDLLPGLTSRMGTATFHPVVCADCGLIRLFASEKARAKLVKSRRWTRQP